MTDAEWNKVYEMSKDKKIYENLITSLFPEIYGNEQVKKGEYFFSFNTRSDWLSSIGSSNALRRCSLNVIRRRHEEDRRGHRSKRRYKLLYRW